MAHAIGGATPSGKPHRLIVGFFAFGAEPSGFDDMIKRFGRAQSVIIPRKLTIQRHYGDVYKALPDGTKVGDADALLDLCSARFQAHPELDLVIATFPFLVRGEVRGAKYEDLFANSRSMQVGGRQRGVAVVSEHSLDTYAERAHRGYPDAIAFVMICVLAVLLTGLQTHDETLGCVMDFCSVRDEVVAGLRAYRFHEDCRTHLEESTYGPAILALVHRFGHPRWWEDQPLVLWIAIALFTVGVFLIIATNLTQATSDLSTVFFIGRILGIILTSFAAFLLSVSRLIKRSPV